MATLHHLDMALIDIRERLTKELQFSADSERQIKAAFVTVFEAVQHLDAVVMGAFAERRRALATALGNPGPSPETIDAENLETARKPKLVKAAAAPGGDA